MLKTNSPAVKMFTFCTNYLRSGAW